jgi:hypothetical protein
MRIQGRISVQALCLGPMKMRGYNFFVVNLIGINIFFMVFDNLYYVYFGLKLIFFNKLKILSYKNL